MGNPAMQIILFGLLLLVLFAIAEELNKEMRQVITLPVKAFIVKGELGSDRNVDDITKLIENVNSVWHVANVSFKIKSITNVEVGNDKITSALEGNGRALMEVNEYDRNVINMFFIKNMSFNGISFPEQRIVVMPDKTTNLEQVAAAHELGHILGMGHNPSKDYLMFYVCDGTALALAEILDARKNAKNLLSSFNSMILPSIVVEFTVLK